MGDDLKMSVYYEKNLLKEMATAISKRTNDIESLNYNDTTKINDYLKKVLDILNNPKRR